MSRSTVFWIIAAVVTIASMVYQRITGPSYPVSGKVEFNSRTISFRFDRSHPGWTNAPVELRTDDPSVTGTLHWKRYRTDDDWTQVPMSYADGILKAELPHQPVAGKLLYRVELEHGGQRVSVAGSEPIVIRFRDDVPVYVLIPHLIAMFGAILFSTRAGLEYFSKEPKLRSLTFSTLAFLFVGGFVLGPLMQYYAFHAWWTGWPIGTDLTDNKTAVAFLVWLAAAIALTRSENAGRWVLAASIVLFIVYLIPHSILGSELKYEELDKKGTITEVAR